MPMDKMKKIGLLWLLPLLFSCSDKDRREHRPVSNAERQLENWYWNVNSISDIKQDTLDLFRSTLMRLSKDASREHRAMALYLEGLSYARAARYELSMKAYEKSLRLMKHSTGDSLQARVRLGIGNYYKNIGKYPEAFKSYYQALKIAEKYRMTEHAAAIHASLGDAMLQKEDIKGAESQLKTSLELLKKQKASRLWLNAAHSLANCYGIQNKFGQALAIDEEGIRITDSLELPVVKVSFLDNKANCFMFMNKLDSAQHYFSECLRIDEQIGNAKQIADSYSNLGYLAMYRKDYKKAEALTLKSIAMLKKINNRHNLAKSYSILVDIYTAQQDFRKALTIQKEFHEQYKDMINLKKEESLAEFRIVYETQKKEQQLSENRILLLEKERESEQKSHFIIALALLAVFLLVIGYLIYRQQRLKSAQKDKEFELKAAISQIETQNKLQEQRLSISRDLHDNIGAQLTFIISSVDAVKLGFDLKSNALARKLDSIADFTKSTIIELRDTIWAMNHTEITFEDLRARILNFIEKARMAREDIDFRFAIDERLNETKLTSVEGINIYRTIQEAVNNAIKHTQASRIAIEAHAEGNEITIRIADNGGGFDRTTASGGNGLANMEKRIDDIGGDFSIESTDGRTVITMRIQHAKETAI